MHQRIDPAVLVAGLTSAQLRRVHRLMQVTGASLELAVKAVQAAGDAPPHKHVRPAADVSDRDAPPLHSEGQAANNEENPR